MDEIIIKERELRENIVQLINNSNLPAFILKPIFKDIFEQLENIEKEQYETAKNNLENRKEKENE